MSDDEDFIETGLCPRCGSDIDFSCRGDGNRVYSCSKCGWSEVVPPMPEW